MRIDNLYYQKSKMSTVWGYLQLLPDGSVTFTKYKGISGQYHILIWLIIKIVVAFQKDKLLLTIPGSDIQGAHFEEGQEGKFAGIGSKHSQITITAGGTEYLFYADPSESFAELAAFTQAVQGQPVLSGVQMGV